MSSQTTQTLDPDIVNLAKATREAESGTDFKASGKSGEYGAYQYEPATWDAQAKSAGVNVSLKDATPEQQNEVWYTWAKSKKEAGYNVGQIASMHNAGEAKPNAYVDGNSGTNSSGVSYDTKAYATKVAKLYQQYKKQGGGVIGSTNGLPNSPEAPKEYPLQDVQSSPDQKPGFAENFQSGNYGAAAGNAVQGLAQGIASPFLKGLSTVGALGNGVVGLGDRLLGKTGAADARDASAKDITENGADYGYLGKAKPIGAGFDFRKADTYGPALADATVTGAEIGSDIAAGQGLVSSASGLLERGGLSAIDEAVAPIIKSSAGIPAEAYSTLSNAEKLNSLTDALKGANASQKIILEKAIQQITPSILKEAGIGSFSELNPVKAKLLGLTGNAIRTWLGLEGVYQGGKSVAGFLKGIL